VLVIGCLLALSAAAAPPAGKTLRVGVLTILSPVFDPAANPIDRALVEGLREHGYALGRNLAIEFRSPREHPERLPQLAAELVALKVDVLVTFVTNPTLAAKEATKTIPIVMVGTADPVTTGVVASLARPGGNITGLGYNAAEISAKRVQLLREAIPGVGRVAVLWNSTLKSMTLGFQQIEQVAPGLGVSIHSVRVAGSGDFDKAFPAIVQGGAGGLIVLYGPMRGDDLPRIVEFVTRNRLPAMFELGRGVEAGGLMAFGPGLPRMARQAGTYVDKIVNGAHPADLPVEEPSQFELVINLKTARALGIAISPALLLRADRIIE
jgi:putative ABC transport system substrate-binding protein